MCIGKFLYEQWCTFGFCSQLVNYSGSVTVEMVTVIFLVVVVGVDEMDETTNFS